MLLSIIVVNYNKHEFTRTCIESIHTHFKSELIDSILEVIIIDNNSTNESAKIIKAEIENKKYRNIKLYQSHENARVGSDNNIGATKARGELLCFLNNKTIIKDKGLLDMIAFISKNQDVAILGGQLQNKNKTLHPSTGKFYTLPNTLLLLLDLQRFNPLNKNPGTINQVDWVKDDVIMIPKKTFDELGGFDSNISTPLEDMELCYRAKQKGYKIYFYPYMQVVFQEQESNNNTLTPANTYKSLLYFFKKHLPYQEFILLKAIITLKAHLLRQYGKITHNGYLIKTYEQALEAIR